MEMAMEDSCSHSLLFMARYALQSDGRTPRFLKNPIQNLLLSSSIALFVPEFEELETEALGLRSVVFMKNGGSCVNSRVSGNSRGVELLRFSHAW
ncbi:hypothetical protein ACE6H2_010971 [Prunus campanulata]